jgi:hypothetical protein
MLYSPWSMWATLNPEPQLVHTLNTEDNKAIIRIDRHTQKKGTHCEQNSPASTDLFGQNPLRQVDVHDKVQRSHLQKSKAKLSILYCSLA